MVESYLLDYSAQDPQTAPAETEPVREAVTVVTGATESLGRALASEFASAGHTLVLVSANEDGLQHLAEELCDDHAVTVHAHACDLALIGGRVSLASALQDAGLDVEFLINAAGAQMDAPLKTAVHDDVMRLVDLNVRATTALTRRFLPGMIARGRGGILSVAAMGAPPMPISCRSPARSPRRRVGPACGSRCWPPARSRHLRRLTRRRPRR